MTKLVPSDREVDPFASLMRNCSAALAALVVGLTLLCPSWSAAQSTLEIDKKRDETAKELGTGIPDPSRVRSRAEQIFGQPIQNQKDEELKSLASDANVYANMVGFILEEYKSYYRENYRYEFVQKAIGPTHDSYVALSNEFLSIRNKAYFNLGLRAKTAGNIVQALLYFRDAYRLSVFSCDKGVPKDSCRRAAAETEMQQLLKIDGITPYLTWQR